jgi:putative mycofactocin binding protein MftB
MACAGSTEPGEAQRLPGAGFDARLPGAGFDASRPYELHPQVALRPEPFGALAYHYGNRRLTFLRSAELVEIVKSLATHDSVTAALGAAGVAETRRETMERALASLESSEVIRAR